MQIVKTDASFGRRAATALGLAIIADLLDYSRPHSSVLQ